VNHTTRSAKAPSHRTGFFATLSDSLRAKGSGAPSVRFLAPVALAIAAFLALAASSALAAGDANQAAAAEACPNEQLRQESLLNPVTGLPFSTQLPECRAYEQVSPPFKSADSVPA
jgi:hypothetical protein